MSIDVLCVGERETGRGSVCVCVTTCLPDVPRNQKRALCLLELELHMLMNYHVGARNKTQILWKSIQCS